VSGATCGTCRFFGGGNQCRLKPPAWISDGTLFQPGWFFPRVDPGDWCGEHATRQPAAVAGLPAPMPLPDGWTWRGERVVGPRGVEVFADDEGDLVISGHWFAPIAVVEAAIAAHRHRVGGAA